MFKKKPMCEVCGEKEASSFSYFMTNPDAHQGEWKFVCGCTSNHENYYIQIKRFFADPPASVDWIAHMHEKSWMDWGNFMTMIYRFRKATNSFSTL